MCVCVRVCERAAGVWADAITFYYVRRTRATIRQNMIFYVYIRTYDAICAICDVRRLTYLGFPFLRLFFFRLRFVKDSFARCFLYLYYGLCVHAIHAHARIRLALHTIATYSMALLYRVATRFINRAGKRE